jgi:oligopeptidase B
MLNKMKNGWVIEPLCLFCTFLKYENSKMIENIQPPIAKIIPTELEKFGDVRVDNYFWLKDRENPEVIDYLHKKNDIMKK